jgi:acetyltransferase
MLSDELSRQGLKLPVLKEGTRTRLAEVLPPESSMINPVDCLPSRTPEQIQSIIKILNEEERNNIDVITIITGNSGLSDNWKLYKAVLEAMDNSSIPIIPVLSSACTCEELIGRVRDRGKIFFPDEVLIGKALGSLARKPSIDRTMPAIKNYSRNSIEDILRVQGERPSPEAVLNILSAAGFRVPFQKNVQKREEIGPLCRETGFPLVMKVIGPLHKSDVGGVKINIVSVDEAESAWNELMKIENAEGVLVQRQIRGTEVILGAEKEGEFGHLIMFGLGGIYTEVLKDVGFALAPVGMDEAMKMINSIKTLPVLKGIRGEIGVSLEILADYLVRLSMLVSDFPQIEEIDLNPVKGFEKELYVVDARIIQRLP